MKKFYTSYFARNAQHPKAIAVCGLLTSWVREGAGFQGVHRPDLGPPWLLVKEAKNYGYDRDEFIEKYVQALEERRLTPQKVADSLPDGAVLLCYEHPNDFCHRHTLAKWLERGANVRVEELLTEEEQRERNQKNLVDNLMKWQ